MNGRQPYETLHLKHVLQQLSKIFGAHLQKCTIVILTNVENLAQVSFDFFQLLHYTASIENVHCIENPYCMFENLKKIPQGFKNLALEESLKTLLNASETVIGRIIGQTVTLGSVPDSIYRSSDSPYHALASYFRLRHNAIHGSEHSNTDETVSRVIGSPCCWSITYERRSRSFCCNRTIKHSLSCGPITCIMSWIWFCGLTCVQCSLSCGSYECACMPCCFCHLGTQRRDDGPTGDEINFLIRKQPTALTKEYGSNTYF